MSDPLLWEIELWSHSFELIYKQVRLSQLIALWLPDPPDAVLTEQSSTRKNRND